MKVCRNPRCHEPVRWNSKARVCASCRLAAGGGSLLTVLGWLALQALATVDWLLIAKTVLVRVFEH